MSVPPVSGSGGEPLVVSGGGQIVNVPLIAIVDGIGQAERVNLNEYMSHLLAASGVNNTALKLATTQTAISRIPFYQELANTLLNLAGLVSALDKIAPQIATTYASDSANVTTLKTNLSNYNSSISTDGNVVASMNLAISNYNLGLITSDTYNAAVSNYNAYVTGQDMRASNASTALTTFNTQAAHTNDQIIQYNIDLNALGESGFTKQSTYPTGGITALQPLALAPPPPASGFQITPPTKSNTTTVSNTITPPVTSASAYINSVVGPFFFLFLPQVAVAQKKLKGQSNFVFYQLLSFLANVPVANLPASYSTPSSNVSLQGATSSQGAGSSVALAANASSLTNPLLNAIISYAIFSSILASNQQQASQPTIQNASNLLALFGGTFLSQANLLSADTAARFGIGSANPASSLVAAALGIAFAQEVLSGISSGALNQGISALLASLLPNLTPAQLQSLVSQIAPALELTLLLTVITSLAQALNSPQLLAQLLATISSAGTLGLLNPGQPTTFDNFFGTQTNAALASQLESEGISAQVATAAVNSQAVQNSTNDQELQANLTAALVQQGIDQSDAVNASQLASSYADELNQANYQAQNVVNENITSSTVANTGLASQGIEATIAANGGTVTGAQLITQTAAAFVAAGQTQAEALLNATLLVSSLNPAVPPTNTANLATELESLISSLTGGTAANNNAIAEQLIATLFGTQQLSAQTLLQNSINQLLATKDQTVSASTVALIKKFINPTLEIYDLAQKLMDPSTQMFYLARGDMYLPDQAPGRPKSVGSNYREDIDIHV